MIVSWAEAEAAWTRVLRAAGRSEQSIALRRHQLGRLAAAMRPRGPWSVTTDDLIGWLGEQGWARETLRSHRAAVRSFYRWAHGAGHVARDPAAGLPAVRPAPPMPRPTNAEALRQALATVSDERVHLALLLGARLGLRRGEMVLVHERDLVDDLVGYSLLVHGKGGRRRSVPVPATLARQIRRACRAGGGWAFPGRIDGHLSAAYLGKLVSRVLPAGQSTHGLRHRFATDAHRVNRDLVTVQELLGHASPETTRRYVGADEDELRRTVLALAGY